jgi:TolB-like protein
MSLPRPDAHPQDSQETRAVNLAGSQFSPGQVLTERFRIIRFIARGGMGEVYEAEDLELRERVALKTIRPEVALDQATVERFRKEVQLARRITHPNVCRLFDLFYHPVTVSPSSPGPRVLFVTMELLNGQTLSQRLDALGRMKPADALSIIAQMAAGLEAAHQAAIVHGDFKSGNVILVPAEGGASFRVVITDFGLARRVSKEPDETVTLAGQAGLYGTPAYMAPEQVQGGQSSAAADIYALGVVMYEMLTGTYPFPGNSSAEVAFKRLLQDPVSPLVHQPDLAPTWVTAILRCLEREPDLRFHKATEVVDSLNATATPTHNKALRTRSLKSLPNRLGIAAGGVAILLAALAGLYSRVGVQGGQPRRSVAILGFQNLTGAAEMEWLSNAFSEMLTTELAAGEKLRTVPGENVVRMKADLGIKEVGTSLASDTLSHIRAQLGSDVIVYGSYVVLGATTPPQIRLDWRLQDARSGEVQSQITEGSLAELLDLVARTGTSLRKELGVSALSAADSNGLRAALPSTGEAARLYAAGLIRLRLSDGPGARLRLEQAIAADPQFALARSALATAWAMSGYARQAKVEAQRALDLSARLSREERLQVEARHYEAAGEWEQAAESYRTLFGFFPDNIEYGLRLAGTRVSAGKPKEALVILDALRKLPPPDRDNPRIDLAAARAAGALDDYALQQKSAATAFAKAEAQGARLLAAGALLLEGIALQNLGNVREAARAFETARVNYEKSGDRWGVANAEHNLAVTLAKSGELTAAKRLHEKTLSLYREFGDRGGEAAALSSIANLQRTLGHLTAARDFHEQAVGIYRETGNRREMARALNDLANVMASAGQLAAAMKMYEDSLPIFREVHNDQAVATILSNLAALSQDRGEFGKASDLYEQSRAIFQKVRAQSSLAFVEYRLGDLQVAKGDLTAGRWHHEQALEIRKQLGEKGSVAESQLAVAQLALQEGLPAPAEALARDAVEEFRKEKRADEEVMGQSILARALLRQGRASEAQQVMEAIGERGPESSNPAVRLAVRTTASIIQVALGDKRTAANTLRSVIVESQRSGLPGLAFEARLALGEVEIASGLVSAGRTRLAALEKEAGAKGYTWIAQRAREAAQK